jgi:hypothetical protein
MYIRNMYMYRVIKSIIIMNSRTTVVHVFFYNFNVGVQQGDNFSPFLSSTFYKWYWISSNRKINVTALTTNEQGVED